MIQLLPNHVYKIRYTDGQTHYDGDVAFFQTLNSVPEAKLLIKVKDLQTGKIVDLVDSLSHPWTHLQEYDGAVPGIPKPKPDGASLTSLLLTFIFPRIARVRYTTI